MECKEWSLPGKLPIVPMVWSAGPARQDSQWLVTWPSQAAQCTGRQGQHRTTTLTVTMLIVTLIISVLSHTLPFLLTEDQVKEVQIYIYIHDRLNMVCFWVFWVFVSCITYNTSLSPYLILLCQRGCTGELFSVQECPFLLAFCSACSSQLQGSTGLHPDRETLGRKCLFCFCQLWQSSQFCSCHSPWSCREPRQHPLAWVP